MPEPFFCFGGPWLGGYFCCFCTTFLGFSWRGVEGGDDDGELFSDDDDDEVSEGNVAKVQYEPSDSPSLSKRTFQMSTTIRSNKVECARTCSKLRLDPPTQWVLWANAGRCSWGRTCWRPAAASCPQDSDRSLLCNDSPGPWPAPPETSASQT